MPCFHPIPALQDGKTVVLHPKSSLSRDGKTYRFAANIGLPCGKCLGCKTARAQEWATRAMHEAQFHEHSIFATLTYAPKHLPKNGALLPRDLTLFLKKLRQAMARRRNHPPALPHGKLRYLASGEYGDLGGRPHYHAILFGLSCSDGVYAGKSKLGNPLYRSDTLTKLWGYGDVDYGEVTAASAAYLASYTIKSIGAEQCDENGEVLEPPFLRQSLKPGIGAVYADHHASDFRNGAAYTDGSLTRLPRYYKKRLAETEPEIAEEADFASRQHNAERQLRNAERPAEDRLVAEEKIAHRRRELYNSRSL